MVSNLQKARRKWEQLIRVLRREGADAWTLVHIYLAVVQSVMIYGSERWVATPHIRSVLGGFYHRPKRRLTGRKPRRGRYGMWTYPFLEDAMAEAGLH